MRFNPLIRNKKYLTQFGQLRRMDRDQYGDAEQTSIVTVSCLVYQETNEQSTTNPAITALQQDRCCLPTSIRTLVREHDHLSVVTDQFGNVVLQDARVKKIIDYNHWRHEPRFFVVHLDVDLD